MSQTPRCPSFDFQDTGPRPTSQDQIKDTKDSEFGDSAVQECVNANSESNVEHGDTSGDGALVDIVDAPPENNSQFEISEAFVSVIFDFFEDPELYEMAMKCDAGFGMNIVKFWDNFKRTMESNFEHNVRVATPKLSLATPGELVNLNIEMEKVLQGILETFHEMNLLINKYRELFSYSLLGPDDSESNVEHGDSSGCGALVDIVDAPPAKKIKFEISEAFVSIICDFLEDEEVYDLAQKSDAGFGMNIVKFRDKLKQAMEWNFEQNAISPSPKLSKATPGELANLMIDQNIKMEQVLQEILETFQKMNGLVNKYRELFSYRMSGDHEEAKKEAKEEMKREEYERLGEEYERLAGERDDNRYWFATVLDNYLPLFLAIIQDMVFIVDQILEFPYLTAFICVIVVPWLISFLQ